MNIERKVDLSLNKPSPPQEERSRHIRRLVVEGFDGGGRGHLGSSMSVVEILQVLYDDIMRHRPQEPLWPGRDRCILSKGHGCLTLYAVLADHGYFPKEDLVTFCAHSSDLGGHPERFRVPGIEASTGALGHGLSMGLGMALAARMQKRDSRVFVVLGDGEIQEGSIWEGAMAAAKHRLSNLTAVIDYNKMQSYGFVSEVQDLEPLADKWRAFGFAVTEVDGHDPEALRGVFTNLPLETDRPNAVICHTVKGKGIPFAENQPDWHHKSRIPPEQIAEMYAALED